MELGWSDTQTLLDLARPYSIPSDAAATLELGSGWTRRWTATWHVGSTPVSCQVRHLGEIDIAATTPMRRFTWRTDQWHRPGLQYMVSTGRHHGHESYAEELLLLAADFAGDLIEALAQPFRLQFWAMGSRVNHTPDFLLLRDRDSPLVIDVRPRHRIERQDAVKFAATAEAALAVGWDYAVVTGWRPYVVSIVDCLSAGRRPLSDPLRLQAQLVESLAAGPCSFGELVDQCDVPAVARAQAIHLLWKRSLGMELSGPLSDSSLIRCAPRAGGSSS